MELINGDWLEEIKKIKDKSIDFICVDPPYGKINGMILQGQKEKVNWDAKINWKKMFEEFNRVIKYGGTIAVFGQNPTYAEMILSNKEDYKYEYIWVKNNAAQGFNADKMPLIYTENIAIFINTKVDRIFNKLNSKIKVIDKEKYYLRWYSQQMLKFIGKTRTKIHKELGHRKLEFWFYFTGVHFNLLSENLYNELIEKYNIDKWEHFIPYEQISKRTFNTKGIKFDNNEYSSTYKNVLNFSKDRTYLHPTQKPVDLLKHLIKIYTNENDIVLDCFMGSGSTGQAAQELNRDFIGIELDENYFNIAKKRLNEKQEKENEYDKQRLLSWLTN